MNVCCYNRWHIVMVISFQRLWALWDNITNKIVSVVVLLNGCLLYTYITMQHSYYEGKSVNKSQTDIG
jgi:hypothetical protein